MSTSRAKTYLMRALTQWAHRLEDEQQIDVLVGITVRTSFGKDWIQIIVSDPLGSPPRYLTVKITENLS